MKDYYLIAEILELNIIEERNGAAFYEALSESATSEQLRQLASAIAKQEKEHEIRFARLRDEIENQEQTEFADSEDYHEYIATLIGTKIFPNEEAAITAAASSTDEQSIKYALRTEYATLNLLQKLKTHLTDEYHTLIDDTINEEEHHIKQLNSFQNLKK